MARLPPELTASAATAPSDRVLALLRQLRLLILDVDGVLTDGRLYYGADGAELKAFNALDGSAMKRLMAAGVAIAIISGRTSAALERRCAELGVAHVYAGVEDKADALAALSTATAIDPERMAHVGDDLADLALFERVGLAVAVPNAHPAAIERADLVTRAAGGHGAVREICDDILASRPTPPSA